jgi:hypothetical protein
METLVAHGLDAGELFYGGTAVGGAALAGANCDMTVIRLIGNSSGGTITLKEVGLVGQWRDSSIAYYNFLFAHDSVDQAILDGETAIIVYTFRTTV